MTREVMSTANVAMSVSELSSRRGTAQRERVCREDLISPCREKLRQILLCCEDVTKRLDILQSNLNTGRIKESEATMEVDCTKIEVLLLQDELLKSKLHIEQQEAVEYSLKQKLAAMEEKIQTLTAQLIVYKEDFDLERRDRESAQGRIAELESQLLLYQRRTKEVQPCHTRNAVYEPQPPPYVDCSRPSPLCLPRKNVNNYMSYELVARGEDVCDRYHTHRDARVERRAAEMTQQSEVLENTGFISGTWLQNPDHGSSVGLIAHSFDICEFFPERPRQDLALVNEIDQNKVSHNTVSTVGNKDVTENVGELCADDVQFPTRQSPGKNISDHWQCLLPLDYEKLRSSLVHTSCRTSPSACQIGGNCDGATHFAESYQLNTENSWSFLPPDETIADESPLISVTQDSVFTQQSYQNEDPILKCPKCRRSFKLDDHFLLLEHLEEC